MMMLYTIYDDDIKRKIHNLYICSNVQKGKFYKRSLQINVKVLHNFCKCF